MTGIDSLVSQYIKNYNHKYDKVFGEGRGKVGYSIYNKLKTGIEPIDNELKLQIRTYLSHGNSFLSKDNNIFGRILNYFCKGRRIRKARHFITKATIGFLVTDELKKLTNKETVAPYTDMKDLKINEITIGILRSAIEARGYKGTIINASTVYRKAVKKPVSYIIEQFAKANGP